MDKKDCAQKAYSELQAVYTDINKSNNDKANAFRIVYEEFVRDLILDEGPFRPVSQILSEALQKFVPQSYRVQKLSRDTLLTLHKYHHPNSPLMTDEGLRTIYDNLLTIIEELSDIKPDSLSLILSGRYKDWMVDRLNNEQKCAVMDNHSMIVVNAGPGTGKTHLLIRKMAYYLENDESGKVVSLSFTNAAADQLKRKSQEYFLENGKTDWNDRYVAGTIHSFCFTQLANYNKSIDEPFDWVIYDDSELQQIAEEIAERLSLVGATETIMRILRDGGTNDDLTRRVENYKKELHFIRVEEILTLYKKTFEKDTPAYLWLKEQGKIDFLLVDESQDLTKSIFEIIKMLYDVNPQMRMFFVGDPRQNIFAFNGGAYDNFKKFQKSMGSDVFKEFNLVRTYRCPIDVVNLVNELQFDDCPNPRLIPDETNKYGKCKLLVAPNSEAEANEIIGLIKTIYQRDKTYDQLCIICTGLWYLEGVAQKMNQEHIPFVVKGGKRTLIPVIQLINYCLRVIDSDNENSKKRLDFRIRNFKESELYMLLKTYRQQMEKGEKILLAKLIQDIVMNLPAEEIEGMNDVAKNYEEMSQTYDSISDFLFDCASKKNDLFSAFYQQDFNTPCITPIDSSAVTLSTIHSAKGLEWDNVIIAGVADGILPNYKIFQEMDLEQRSRLLNDEKKKYYVAVTRSSENLWLTYSATSIGKFGKITHRNLSPFVNRKK